MHDGTTERPDRASLFQLASTQRGYFTAAQAHAYGYSRALLAYHAKAGMFNRVHTGVYRFRDYPAEPYEDVMAAWLALGQGQGHLAVSHVSALELWGLSDLIPNAIHFSIPRTQRHFLQLPGVIVHTTSRSLAAPEVRVREGLRTTSPERSILDIAEAGGAPEQVELAISQAVERGWLNPASIRQRAGERGSRVAELVEGALLNRAVSI